MSARRLDVVDGFLILNFAIFAFQRNEMNINDHVISAGYSYAQQGVVNLGRWKPAIRSLIAQIVWTIRIHVFSAKPTSNMISRAGFSILRHARTHLGPTTGPTPIASLSALARLSSSLAVLEQRDGKLNQGSLGTVTAAQKLGGSITAFVAGSNIKGVAEEAAKVAGVEKVIAVDNGAYDKVSLYTTDLIAFN